MIEDRHLDIVSKADGLAVSLPRTTAPAPPAPHTRARRLPRVALRVGLGLIVVLLALAGAGAMYEVVAAAQDAAAYPPPGRLFDVGGHRLHISCLGEGSPTVVFESGLANMSADWARVQARVASTTRACAYDRAGIAWSESGPEPRDSLRIAGELHTLLGNAAIPSPYVLVGQSFGGLYVRVFADQYPDEVAGVVFADASHPDMWQRVEPGLTAAMIPSPGVDLAYRGLSHLGITRLTSTFPIDCGLDASQCGQEGAWMTSARQKDAFLAEMGAPERDAQVRASASLGARPLVVLTASNHADIFGPVYVAQTEPLWRQMQDELAALSTNSVHLLVDGATHSSLQTRDAAVTSAAVEQVVQAARTGEPLK